MFLDVTQSHYEQLITDYFAKTPEIGRWFLKCVPTAEDFRQLNDQQKRVIQRKDPVNIGHLFLAAEIGEVVLKSPQPLLGHAYSSNMVGLALMDEYYGEQQESVMVLCTDVHNEIIARQQIFIGGSSQCSVYPDQIFRYALQKCARGVIIVHNHPSGYSEPSDNDLAMAKRNERAGNMIGVQLVDFIIIGNDNYYSWRESRQDL